MCTSGKLTCTFQLLPKERVPSSFRLNQVERFLFCSSVTQTVREMRATLVGNTLLGNTVAPTYIKEDRMPKSAFYTLTWSSSSQAYELYGGQGNDVLDRVPDSPALSVWVSRLSSFAFHGQNGSYTARKELK